MKESISFNKVEPGCYIAIGHGRVYIVRKIRSRHWQIWEIGHPMPPASEIAGKKRKDRDYYFNGYAPQIRSADVTRSGLEACRQWIVDRHARAALKGLGGISDSNNGGY